MEDLKKDIKENLSKAGKENAAHKTEENVINAVCDATEIDIPDAMINSQIDKMLRDFDMNMRYQGLNLEQYLKYTGMTVDKMREQFKDDAAKNVKTSLVLEKICEAEGIDASEDEINKEYESMAESNGMKIEDIKKYVSEDDVKETIKARNTIKFLVDNANFK